ncbi:ABC transporter ATP-binding protein [Rhodococcus chondri]|uniref:ABC transporter ATP-binding protein n=1 Tax=Rhodococcus chondri TaxID=3065941 RepID=A0ABU7JYG8_9NOCA|nr:ABC transporter ATP-binding protein [Rhodococcus sp. CC-R104]MEE2035048.1 ABC transporter ATP-binding protein [Rhodococcus sp. CC-R104]
MDPQHVIEVRDLHKHFGHVHALDGLDLTVDAGEIHGFLGPNGSGKSTTLRVLLGILRATSGRVRMLGRDPWSDAVTMHRDVAYVPGDVTLWPSLTGGETIDLLARLRSGLDEHRRDELIARFALDPRKKTRSYSKGNRQKVALISALSSHARILLLDEPTSGLDPLMEQVFRDCARESVDRGATILLSSHILSEVEALCQKVTIIRDGRTVDTGAVDEMRHLSRTSITAELLGDPGDLHLIPGVTDVTLDGSTLHCQVDNDDLGRLIRLLGDTGVRSLISTPPTLEELFLRHYRVDTAPEDRTAPKAEERA